MSEKMARPSLKPKKIHEFAWWYEDKRGITVVQEARRPDGAHLSTEQCRIPWSRLLEAAKRCGR